MACEVAGGAGELLTAGYFRSSTSGRCTAAAFASVIRSPRHAGCRCGSGDCRLACPIRRRLLHFSAAVRLSKSDLWANRSPTRGRDMADGSTPKWPALLFAVTVLSGVASTAATFYYYRSTTLLQDQEKALAEKRAQYQADIEDLKKRVVTTQTITQSIDMPVVTMRRQCINILGINDICTNVPESRIEQRAIQATVPAEDPKVKAALDTKLKELEALSAKAVNTQQKQVSLKELVDALRGLVAPLISILVSLASIVVILSKKYKAESEKWAYGSLGTILGFWLK